MTEMSKGAILHASPGAAVEGGEVTLTCRDYDTSDYALCRVYFGGERGHLVSAAPQRVIAAVPELPLGSGADTLRLTSAQGELSYPLTVGEKLAENLHPVGNPVIDREDGSIYVTLSGSRGQKTAVSIYQVAPDGTTSPFLSDVINPSGMVFDEDGVMYVSSRHEGELYRVTPFKEVSTLASDLGVATGLAIDRRGTIYVGDRTGTIHAVNQIGESRVFASVEPSVAAFHLAFSPAGDLYVTGPTVSSSETVYRIDVTGEVHVFFKGLGRPQGIAFDEDGNLYVCASYRGQRGVVRISPAADKVELVVAGSGLVGLAFDDHGNLIVANTSKVYRVPLGVRGYSMF